MQCRRNNRIYASTSSRTAKTAVKDGWWWKEGRNLGTPQLRHARMFYLHQFKKKKNRWLGYAALFPFLVYLGLSYKRIFGNSGYIYAYIQQNSSWLSIHMRCTRCHFFRMPKNSYDAICALTGHVRGGSCPSSTCCSLESSC